MNSSKISGKLDLFPLVLLAPIIWIARGTGQSRKLISCFGAGMNSPRVKRKAFKGYMPGSQDVIVAAYAKSGTNWAMQIALQIAHLGDAEFDFIHDVVPWPDAPIPLIRAKLEDKSLAADSPTGLRVIKTHWEQDFVPYSSEAKYVVIIRDPKEIFVSGYFFAKSTFGSVLHFDYSPEEWFELFLSNRYIFGSWAEHTASWWPLRQKENVFLESFTEMKRASGAMIQQIADLMEVELEEDQMARVIEKSSFAYMKAIEHKFVLPLNLLVGEKASQLMMMRKGETGGSSEMLNGEQKARIDKFAQEELARIGSDFPYENFFINT